MTRFAVFVVATFRVATTFTFVTSCAAFAPSTNTAKSGAATSTSVAISAGPVWQTALPQEPELYARIRVATLMRDERLRGLVEPLQRAALPRDEARVVLAPVIDRSEELVVAARGGNTVIALLGVRADTWPDAIVDPEGQPAFHEVAHTDKIVEQQTRDGNMSLFVLPGRTWIIASGKDRARVRRELVSARPEPPPDDLFAIAELRFRGADLVRQIPQLAAGNLTDIGNHLVAMHLVIERSAGERMMVRLTYAKPADRKRSEDLLLHIKEVATKSGKLPWFASADVVSEDRAVILTWDLTAVKASAVIGATPSAVPAPATEKQVSRPPTP